jgi:hypothetical protein
MSSITVLHLLILFRRVLFLIRLSLTFILCQVLYKSRCDNRLNEITERASSDKREVHL